jgi:hypothetical protein
MRRAQLIGLAGIVVASGLWATPAAGQEGTTGNNLLSYCAEALKAYDDRTTDDYAAGRCRAYIEGIAMVSDYSDTPLYRRVCLPSQVTVGQAVRVVYKWLEDHPERLHERQGILVIAALRDAFPCSP